MLGNVDDQGNPMAHLKEATAGLAPPPDPAPACCIVGQRGFGCDAGW